MFKKSRTNKQFDLFDSPSGLMCSRESRLYDKPSAWHNKFYREVTSKIDEEIIRPLFAESREDKKRSKLRTRTARRTGGTLDETR